MAPENQVQQPMYEVPIISPESAAQTANNSLYQMAALATANMAAPTIIEEAEKQQIIPIYSTNLGPEFTRAAANAQRQLQQIQRSKMFGS